MHTFRDDSFNWARTTWPEGADATADITHWEYEPATGLLLAKRDALGKALTYTYEAAGRLKTRTWARHDVSGQPIVTTYAYDQETGELLTASYSDGTTPAVAYGYDRLGRHATVTDGVGDRAFAYNAQTLELQTETIAGLTPAVITHNYEPTDVIGRPSGFTLGSTYQFTYGYEPATGRFQALSWNVNGKQDNATYAYTPQSDLLVSVALASGQHTTYAYEPNRDLKTQVRNAWGNAVVSQYEYAYDAVGRRASVKNSGSAFAAAAFTKWGYDERNQLTQSERYLGNDATNTSNSVPAEARGYHYDPIGNRQSATTAGVPTIYKPNELNQYTAIDSATLSYDADGNLLQDATRKFAYNAENQLLSVEPVAPVTGDARVAFAYDYVGRRVKKTVQTRNGSSWQSDHDLTWVYNGWNPLEERRIAASVTTKKNFVWGLDLSQSIPGAGGIGGLLAAVDASGGQSSFAYDGNGNVSELLAVSGSIAAHYEYDAFGNMIVALGNQAQANAYRFSTKYADDDTKLVYYGYRYYESQAGGWLGRDPAGENGGVNLY
jgi:RHS repeat-associated protein